MDDITEFNRLIQIVKNNMLKTIDAAKTGHVGACCSSTELMTVLYFTDLLRYDIENPSHPNRDYVLVRGHLGPLRYNIFSLLGWLKPEEMVDYRKYGSRLCGHEDMNITPGVDITPSGSLGMLLSYAVGASIGFRNTDRENRIFCFLGDGEEQEGNVSEAARHASNINCLGLITIIDANTKQLSTSTGLTDGGSNVKIIWKGYGWNVLTITDGHDPVEIYFTLKKAIELSKNGPVCVIAQTVKGNGLEGAQEHYCGYHVYHNNESNISVSTMAKTLSTLIPISYDPSLNNVKLTMKRQDLGSYLEPNLPPLDSIKLNLEHRENMCSYDYLDEFLYKLNNIKNKVYILTADYPPRLLMDSQGNLNIPGLIYINVGVREQHLCAMAHGIRVVDKSAIIILLCGDAFMYRCADQVNVLAQSQDNIIIYNVQAGLSGAQNGATHQSSGQSGAFVTMPGISVFETSSKADWEFVMNRSLLEPGLKYIRTHKGYSLNSDQKGNFYEIEIKLDSTESSNNSSGIENLMISDLLRTTVTSQIVNDIIGYTDYSYILITSGMITANAVEAAKILLRKGIKGKMINIVSLKNLEGISELIPAIIPIFFFYNGNVEIMSSFICRQLCINGVTPGTIHEYGFNLGVTGSISDVMKHFKFDPENIVSIVESNI